MTSPRPLVWDHCLGNYVSDNEQIMDIHSKYVRILEFLDDPVGVELRRVFHVPDERRRRRFLLKHFVRIRAMLRVPLERTYHSYPAPGVSTLTNGTKVVSKRPVLLLPILCCPEVVDSANCSLDIGEVGQKFLLCGWFGTRGGFLDKIALCAA